MFTVDPTRGAIEKDRVTAVALVVALATGVAAYRGMERAEDPDFPIRVAQVATFRPGMSFAVTLDVHGKRYPLVPEISVRYGTDGAFVWVVREDAAVRVPVRIVERQEAAVLVDAALEEGEAVVVEGIQRLRPGLPVRVTALAQAS